MSSHKSRVPHAHWVLLVLLVVLARTRRRVSLPVSGLVRGGVLKWSAAPFIQDRSSRVILL